MKPEIIKSLNEYKSRLFQELIEGLEKTALRNKPESSNAMRHTFQKQLDAIIDAMGSGNGSKGISDRAEELAGEASAHKIKIPEIISSLQTGKKMILRKIDDACAGDAASRLEAIDRLDDIFGTVEINFITKYCDKERSLQNGSEDNSHRDDELKHLRAKMAEVERTGKTLTNLGVQLILLDKDRRILWANKAAKGDFKSVAEGVGWTCGQARGIPEGVCANCPVSWSLSSKSMERSLIEAVFGKDRKIYEVTAFPLIDDDGVCEQVLVLLRDVTDTILEAAAKQKNEEFYRILFEHSGTAVCVLEPDKTISRVNRRFLQITGYASDEVESKLSFPELIAAKDRQRMAVYHERRRVNPGGVPESYVFSYVTKDRTERRAVINVGLVPGTMQSICSIRDITDEEQTKEFLEAVLYGSVDAIVGINAEKKIVSWNIGAERLFGYRDNEIIGKPVSVLWGSEKDAVEDFEHTLAQAIETGSVQNHESDMMTRLGNTLVANMTLSLLKGNNDETRGYSLIVHDITEQKALEKQVIQAEKLAAIGQLTAGLAHEMGTPLNIVSGRAEYLMADLEEEDPKRESLEIIIHQSERMTKLIDNLLKFSRPQKVLYSKIDLSEVMEGVLNLLETQLEQTKIAVDFHYSPDLPLIEADFNQLQQVFLNLILNCIQAMPRGGQIIIYIKQAENEEVKISIADTGVGIEPKYVSRIFEPFFTTKDSGQGTGLGLAIVAKIIRDHSGAITVESHPGKGALFEISIPIEQARAAKNGARKSE